MGTSSSRGDYPDTLKKKKNIGAVKKIKMKMTQNQRLEISNVIGNDASGRHDVVFVVDTGFSGSPIFNANKADGAFAVEDVCTRSEERCFDLITLGDVQNRCSREYKCETTYAAAEPFLLMDMSDDLPNIMTIDALFNLGDVVSFRNVHDNLDIIVYDDERLIPNHTTVPMRRLHGACVVQMSINGIKANVIVDTGSPLTLAMCRDWVDRNVDSLECVREKRPTFATKIGVNNERIKSERTKNCRVALLGDEGEKKCAVTCAVYLNDRNVPNGGIDGFLGIDLLYGFWGGNFAFTRRRARDDYRFGVAIK